MKSYKFKIIFIFFIIFFGIFFFAKSSLAANFYITQNASGNNTGADCTNAFAVTWFNTPVNWANPKQAGKVGPGDTVHLCGIFIFTANDSSNGLLRIPGSGSSGSPITILFEPGAKLQSPQFSINGAIMCHWYWGCHGNVIIDGGTNGIIENTANGTGLAYHGASTGVVVSGWSSLQTTSNVEVKNLTIRNIYLNLGLSQTASDTDGQFTSGISIADNLTNISIHNNIVSNSRIGIGGGFDKTTWNNIDIHDNYISDHCWGINLAGLSVTSQATDVKIHNNEITDWQNWQCPANAAWCNDKTDVYHTDGIILWSGNNTGTPVYAPLVYNNYIHGHLGRGSATGFIYCTVGNPVPSTTSGSECIIFNNLLIGENGGSGTVWFGGYTKNNKLYNNVIVETDSNPSSTFNPCIISSSLGGDIYKNNICINFSQVFATQWAGDPATIISAMDNNIFYNFNTPDPNRLYFGNGYSYSLAQWRALGRDLNSVITNPLLDNSYKPTVGSSAINAGVDLSAVGITALNSDKAGATRPQGSGWDIGAYEYVSATDTTPPLAPSGVSVS